MVKDHVGGMDQNELLKQTDSPADKLSLACFLIDLKTFQLNFNPLFSPSQVFFKQHFYFDVYANLLVACTFDGKFSQQIPTLVGLGLVHGFKNRLFYCQMEAKPKNQV